MSDNFNPNINNNPDPIRTPGHLYLASFEIEIQRMFREQTEGIILSFDEFTPPIIDTRSFQVIWGPGMPAQEFAGPVAPMGIEMSLTTFYQKDIWEYFVQWREDALQDTIANRHNGSVVGYDENGDIQYKATLIGVWCKRVDFGRAARNVNRHSIAVSLAVYDYIHDFDYANFRQQENIVL